jgi:hypothetical protein
VATEQLTPMGAYRGTLVWETNLGTLLTDIHVEATPPYAVEPGDPTTAIRQKLDLVKLCDCEPRRGINNWERGARQRLAAQRASPSRAALPRRRCAGTDH